MSALQRILVPVDFSEESANDLKYAVSLAQETHAELVVLHVTQKRMPTIFGPTRRYGRSADVESASSYSGRPTT